MAGEEVAAEHPPETTDGSHEPEQAEPAVETPAPPAEPASKTITKQILSTCLTKGLAALCTEKPAEPVRWLAEWLLEHNPNTPVITIPNSTKVPPIGAGEASLTNSEINAISAFRGGNILGASSSLAQLDLSRGASDSNSVNSVNGVVEGCTFFHQVSQHHVGSVGPCSSKGVAAAIGDMLQNSRGKPKCVQWLSVRHDPTIYLGGEPYALRGGAAGASEESLQADVQTEISERGGRIAVMDVKGKGKWLHVAAGDALTPADVVNRVRAPGNTPVRYISFPTPAGGFLSTSAIDDTLAALAALDSEDPIIIATDKGDGAPSAMFCVLACMAVRVRAAGGTLPQDVLPKEPLPIVAKYAPARQLLEDVQEVASLIASLGEEVGPQAKLLLDDTIDSAARNRFRNLRTAYLDEVKAGQESTARTSLVQYLQLLTVAAILISPEEEKDTPHQAFADVIRGG